MAYFQNTSTPGLSAGAFNSAAEGFQSVQQNATPSASIRDTAADRVSSRIAAKQRADERTFKNSFAGRGRALSGGLNSSLAANRIGNTSALGSALADLEADFEDSRLQGLGLVNTASAGLGGLGRDYSGATNQGLQTKYDYRLGTDRNAIDQFRADTERDQGNRRIDLGEDELAFKENELETEDQRFKRDQVLDFFAQFAPDGAGTVFQGNANVVANRNSEYQQIIDQIINTLGI